MRFRGDEGLSLVEIIIALGLLVVVLVFSMRQFWSVERAATGAFGRLDNLNEARVAVDRMDKVLRAAVRPDDTTPAFETASASDAVFYASLGGCRPNRVRLYRDSVRALLMEEYTAWATDVAGNCVAQETRARVVAQNVISTTFTYRADGGTVLERLPLSADDRSAIRSVGIAVSVGIQDSTFHPPAELTTLVRLPNAYLAPAP